MADAPQKVIVQVSRIDASIIPPNFPLPYKLYVIQQTGEMQSIAEASNGANELAYQAALTNQAQDATLSSHEAKLTGLRDDVDDQDSRITENSDDINSLALSLATAEEGISSLTERVAGTESSVTALQGDYVSKSATALQTLASPISVATSYSVNGVKVIGARQTGWTAATGTALLGAFNASQAYSASATYSQAEISALASGLVQARQRIKALEDAMRTHGLIN